MIMGSVYLWISCSLRIGWQSSILSLETEWCVAWDYPVFLNCCCIMWSTTYTLLTEELCQESISFTTHWGSVRKWKTEGEYMILKPDTSMSLVCREYVDSIHECLEIEWVWISGRAVPYLKLLLTLIQIISFLNGFVHPEKEVGPDLRLLIRHTQQVVTWKRPFKILRKSWLKEWFVFTTRTVAISVRLTTFNARSYLRATDPFLGTRYNSGVCETRWAWSNECALTSETDE